MCSIASDCSHFKPLVVLDDGGLFQLTLVGLLIDCRCETRVTTRIREKMKVEQEEEELLRRVSGSSCFHTRLSSRASEATLSYTGPAGGAVSLAGGADCLFCEGVRK